MTAVTTLQTVEESLAALRRRHDQGRGQLELLEGERARKQAALEALHGNVEVWRQVQVLFTKVSEYARQQLKARIEETVTAALQAVLGNEGYRFEVEVGELGGKPSAEWRVVSPYAGGGEIAGNPEEDRGGGIADIVSLALRLALMELSRPKPGGPVLLDEPGKHVSAEYAENQAFFLKGYAQRTGRQVVLVTHNPQLAAAADRAYLVSQTDGKSEVKPA